MAGKVQPATYMPAVEAWGMSDTGLVRRNNEDRWFVDVGVGLAVVADGMGGANCGEVASSMAVDSITERFRAGHRSLREAILEANRVVRERAVREPGCRGMGSTVVVAAWSGDRLSLANVGDSRAYRWRNGALTQLSYDQTLVNELRTQYGWTDRQAEDFPHKHVLTMAIGTTAEPAIRMREEAILPGDRILLCSDGLSGPVRDGKITEILGAGGSVQECVERLVNEAIAAGGPDNVTAVVVRFV